VFFGTLAKRKVPHIYVANWFFGAFILTVALLHIVNSAAMPATFWKSYSAYAGAQDAMVQWWYGHNAVGFFLTAGFLGMMYYFIPKQAGRPIYSYRLSVVHFWALIFTVHVGRARTTCTTPRCPTGRSRSAWCSRSSCSRRRGAG
jgi:cytochrome c oxidase cbb3-type subunit 1